VAAAVLALSCPVCSQQPASDKQICDVRADSALGLEQYSAAINLHRAVLRAHPNNALAHYHLGFAYGMVGRSAEEIVQYRAAANLGLQKWDLFLNLGLAYADRQEFPSASVALEHAALLAPLRAETHLNLALIYETQNKLPGALREVTTARHLAPQDLDAANTNAIICVEIGDLVCARNIWTRLVRTAPNYYPGEANLAILSRTTYIGPVTTRRDTERSPLIGVSPASVKSGPEYNRRQ
jgi:tetratricopeptide (TPR) repeat protein